MLTTLQTQKLTRTFRLLDADRDGFMEQADCELVIHATSQVMGYAIPSPEYRAYHREYMTGWEELLQLSGSDDDERLTLVEYLTAHENMMTQMTRGADPFRGILKTIITRWDSNQDGKVSQAEYQAYLVALNTPKAEAAEAFQRLDCNGDGYLTTDALLRHVEEFFRSDDPQALGNWLVGPF